MIGLIRLRRRDGSVVAYAIVDAADFGHLSEHRWHRNQHGYAVATIGGRKVRMNRLLTGLRRDDRRQADHISGDRLDNRRANLRVGSHADNQANRVKLSVRNKSGFRGVSRTPRGRWRASVRVDNIAHNLGEHSTPEIAAAAAAAFRAEHMPFSADARAAA